MFQERKRYKPRHPFFSTIITAIVFDIGGILYPESSVNAVYNGLIKKFHLNENDFHKAKRRHVTAASQGKMNAKEHIHKMAADLHVDADALAREWHHLYLEHVTLNHDVDTLIRMLKHKYVLATMTNITMLHHSFRKKIGLFYHHFPIILASCNEGYRKPQITLYRRLLKHLHRPPREVIFIDDNPKYLVPARKLGMKTILFKNARQLKRDLAAFGVKA